MKNVTGITSIAGGSMVDAIKSELRKLGYNVECRILRAEDYGVPQERRRIVFLGKPESNRLARQTRHSLHKPEESNFRAWMFLASAPGLKFGSSSSVTPGILAKETEEECRKRRTQYRTPG